MAFFAAIEAVQEATGAAKANVIGLLRRRLTRRGLARLYGSQGR